MGRHSANRARTARQLRRIAMNSLFVLTATSFVTVLMYAGIASYAAVKAAEIPPPTIDAWAQPVYPQSGGYDAYAGQAYAAPAPDYSAGGEMRRCPATGCTASTCHAETGEPIPRR